MGRTQKTAYLFAVKLDNSVAFCSRVQLFLVFLISAYGLYNYVFFDIKLQRVVEYYLGYALVPLDQPQLQGFLA
ncbi:MAG: hypothetical protein ABSF52_13965 [Syntrophobacteraceae bacterium]